MEKILLEAPVFTVEAAIKAAEYGIDRLELCSDFGEGGETPSAGMLTFLKEKVDIPIFVMLRPRGGDFVYSSEELYVMKKDIAIFKNLGADGFVFGVLDQDGQVDREACKYLINVAGELPCTFHRAFDITADKKKALNTIIDLGFQRILTSGGENDVSKGLENILELLEMAKDDIIIMPGGGSKPEHVSQLNRNGHLREIHASCKSYRPTQSSYFHPSVSLSSDPLAFRQVLTVDQNMVNLFRKEIAVQ
ncbi:copper homeostasis protein CutC [Aquiflexum sp. LQ15W]|uniref:copper homeostasis protein CutC n=1 Tax=Cognataquiflexum nitidum TaxID=2922272 RepID=UPI001F13459D|nr:copper homeostasis protein CutC [Cognataquiflexum nitidum]MCH6199416.1 copper homeostasis protein CutC [Cognataquiflexum nitidum]